MGGWGAAAAYREREIGKVGQLKGHDIFRNKKEKKLTKGESVRKEGRKEEKEEKQEE